MDQKNCPDLLANLYPEGTIEFGKDDSDRWVVKQTESGVKEWVPFHSTTLFNFTPLTAKILEQNINKPIIVYERQSQSMWPKCLEDFDVKYTFIPSGDAEKVKTKELFPNWLVTKTPAVNNGDYVIIKGTMESNDIEANIQVGTLPCELVSSNLMNTDAFIHILHNE